MMASVNKSSPTQKPSPDHKVFSEPTKFSPEQLIKAGRILSTPMTLNLPSAALGEIRIEKVLRLLPGKRLTALARWHNSWVVIKLFFDPQRWSSHWREETLGHEALKNAKISTPRLLVSEQHADQAWGISVYEYLQNAVSGEIEWQTRTSSRDKLEFLENLAAITAQLHQHHLMQWDNHLDNFLVIENTLVVVDCGGIHAQPRITPTQALSNLALLAAQFARLHTNELETLLGHYLHCRARTKIEEFSLPAFQQEILHQRRGRIENYIEKCQRECTEVAVAHPRPGHFLAARRSLIGPELLAWSKHPHVLVNSSPTLKDGNSQTVVCSRLDERDVVIKRYNIKSVGHWIKRIGRSSRARNAWCAAHGLLLLKVPTPQPVALVEQAIGPAHGPAFFVAAHCNGLSLGEAAVQSDAITLGKLAEQVADIFATLLSARISHGDTKATNFLVENDKVWVIDLDAVKFHRDEKGFFRAFKKDLDRFMRNWEPGTPAHASFATALAPLYKDTEHRSRKAT